MLKLDPNDNFSRRLGSILNLDIHNSSLNYPWVMTPLSDTLGNQCVCPHCSKVKRICGM
jgi:hypothetical protein